MPTLAEKQMEAQMLEAAVDEFAAAMKKRLLVKLEANYFGWDDPGYMKRNDPARLVGAYIKAGQFVDAANWSMFFWWQDKKEK